MKPWQIRVTRFFHLSLEMLFLFMLLIPFYTAEGTPLPIFSFTVLVACGIIFYQPFIEKYKSEKVGLLLIPILALVGMSLGFSFFLGLLLATIVFWRVLYHVKDNDPNEMGLLIVTFLVGVVFYLYFFYMEVNQVFLVITFVQFFLILSLKVLKLSFLSSKSATDKWNQMKWQLGGLAALGSFTVLAVVSYDLIRLVVTFIFRQVLYVVWLLGVPFVYLASLLNIPLRRRGPAEEAGFYNNEGEEIILEEVTATNLDILPWIIGIIIFIVILYLIFKKAGVFTLREYVQFSDKEEASPIRKREPKTSWFSSSRPKNEIRRLFYDFEKFMAKQGEGRRHNETVEDWFKRMSFNDDHKDVIVTTYESVRYGDKEVSKTEKEHYRRVFKELKKELKKGNSKPI
ncbi:hypothetical protein DS745_20190 [Anaerobacillus alkaliphilus]|uniref:DUF4129 domain-containing protein n=1 Tax=Anaerobacillus alkaliphilus TaxID=1548597 RepID=A0A4Q0VRU0_9BACI|nr:hypothetical protein [Anaerobacillus alkaliphilus]RXI98637.1 hypothetical protein DS745_20190 [Anaerobacillus alkaliphilus]